MSPVICDKTLRCTLAIAFIFYLPVPQAADHWQVDGEHGELHAQGQLFEGACHLDMISSRQLVALGTISRANLLNVGNEAEPVNFHIRMVRCQRTGGHQSSQHTGADTWTSIEPVVTLTFSGVADATTPALLAVTPANGLALKLSDSRGRLVRLNERGEPQVITAVTGVLDYTVTPIRTGEDLTSGDFQAVANFEVNYE
ncbi:type 1 fimbrial protein [Enterobacter mori]|uniref:Type 1 fimbrial protein n=1 Tax=Enterobacter mori TaxID=539813 RepID=A0A7T0GZY1_9ENTR|nr:fimbrial protein [Enterobacter mori]QPJ99574.1 type 1 fimbrial protein [Enterobacter mori]